jgi:hypothetical protein
MISPLTDLFSISSFFFAGIVVASANVIDLDFPEPGNVMNGTVVTHSNLNYKGATFDLSYTINAIGSEGANAYVEMDEDLETLSIGVHSGVNLKVNLFSTLEGDAGEGLSFTNLKVTNFAENGSGLSLNDIEENLFFSEISLSSVGNGRDRIGISSTGFYEDIEDLSINEKVTQGESQYTISLLDLAGFDTDQKSLYLSANNGWGTNRWKLSSVKVDIPETGSVAFVVGLMGLTGGVMRRRPV